MNAASMDLALLQAFIEARYEVTAAGSIMRLQVGCRAPDALPIVPQGACTALLTACNPGAQRLHPADNRARMDALDLTLEQASLPVMAAVNSAADGSWKEPGRLVEAPDLASVDALARRFGQLAVLVIGTDRMVRLRCYAPAPLGFDMDTRFIDFVPCAATPAHTMTELDDDAPAPLLRARRLSFMRGEERIFGPLDFELAGGGVLVIEGGNGAGKTSLLRVLAGLLPAADEGDDQGAADVQVNRSCALLGHSLGLTGELDAVENLRFAAGLTGEGAALQPQNALRSVGLEGFEDIPVSRLSAGQRKRVALARLLVAPAAIWLLDEPYANLDPDGIALVNRLIERHTHRGGGVVLTSHGAQLPLNQTSTRVLL